MSDNMILKTDSYKFSHYMQYPPGATDVSSYVEARGSKIEGVTEVVMFGLQAFINEVLLTRITRKHVDEAETFCTKHGVPFNRDGWMIIVNDHGGYMPLEIEAVPEGTPVPLQNMMIQMHTLDDRLPWLTSYVETMLLSYVWYGSTVATLSREIKRTIKAYLDKTSDNPDAELPFKLHDFGYRGVAAGAGGLGGAAHLVNFMGTDTVAGIEFADEHYDAGVCGFSISASEHSTMTSWGEENEYEAYKNMVKAYAKPGAIFACVIDSYDTFRAVKMFAQDINPDTGMTLLDEVKAAGAKLVLRPDSGDAIQMPIDVINLLMRYVGYETNSKGYAVLPSHVGVIQGDGIDHKDVEEILRRMEDSNLSASNIAFGMGGGLLQKVNRDTFKFAMKANAIEIDGAWKDVVKNPVTDPGKKSKAGIQMLLRKRSTGEYVTVDHNTGMTMRSDDRGWYKATRIAYRAAFGGVSLDPITFDEVRNNAAL